MTMARTIAACFTVLCLSAPATATEHRAALAGHYDGHQMELGAELVLRADGRFDYGLSYGALDEEASGSWALVDGAVVLTGDPVVPPRFVFLGQKPAPPGTIKVSVEAPPGMSLQYFESAILLAKGTSIGGQLGDDGAALPLRADDPPVKIRLGLPIYEVASDAVTIDPAKGYWLSFRFEPHDIGKADLRGTRLALDHGDLVFERFGRNIRFHRDGGGT